MNVSIATPHLDFPHAFCCNCGGTTQLNSEIQETRISRLFGVSVGETTFKLAIPICAGCVKTIRRPPSGWLRKVLVFVGATLVLLGLLWYASGPTWPTWITNYKLYISAALALALVIVLYRMRRPKPPQTSFYQPVRIRDARVQFDGGQAEIAWIKLAFTNAGYLAAFTAANSAAIQARRVAVVKARA
jgi:hypothetical protein